MVAARELTKKFEEFLRGDVEYLIKYFKENQPRGEFTIVVEGFNQEKQGLEESNEPLSTADICDLVQALVQEGVDKKTAIKKIAVKLNLSRRDVYQTMLEAEKKEDIN